MSYNSSIFEFNDMKSIIEICNDIIPNHGAKADIYL